MREMVDDYSKQLELRDQTIRQLHQQNDVVHQNEVSILVYKENEALKQENHMLRDKVLILEDEINRSNQQRPSNQDYRAIQDEVDRLTRVLVDNDRQTEMQLNNQKNEWADIYSA